MPALTHIDPTVTFCNSQMETVRGTIISLQRKSLVVEIYNPYSIVQVSEVLNRLEIKSHNKKVYDGKAVVASMVNTGLTALVSANFIDEWQDLNNLEITPGGLREEANNFIQEWESRFQIRPRYQTLVNELRGFLADAARWVGQIDMTKSLPKEPTPTGTRLHSDYFAELSLPIAEKVTDYFNVLEEESALIENEQLAAHQAFSQAALHPLLLRAPFLFRAYSKPLGYAGDYEMVQQMLSDPRQGQSTYFELINGIFLRTPVVVAHRNRIQLLVQFLERLAGLAQQESRPFRILNIACGPAFEVQEFLQTYPYPEWLSFQLLDFSQEALDWTKQQIAQIISANKNIRIEYIHDSVHNLLKWQATRQTANKEFDAIYCAGLFDYLSDKVCRRLLEYSVARTVQGGSILVTNVHVNNPHKLFGMEHLLEWYLIYRDEKQMEKLVLPEAQNHQIYSDKTGVNVFLEMQINE